jgi:ribonuclease BN (tRNA processing enzyme)
LATAVASCLPTGRFDNYRGVVDLTVVGCSGSFPGPESPASSYLVTADGFRLVIDLGNGALGQLQRYLPIDQIDAICLSHLHSDHCLDMCSLHVACTFHPGGPVPKIPVYAPAGTADRLARAAAPGGPESGRQVTESFDIVTLSPGTFTIGPVTVTVDHMNHPVETFGFRLEHGGKVIAYSADTGPSDGLVALARGADALICEATFAEGRDLPANLHLTAGQAGQHAARADAGRLVLTHLMPWNDAEAELARARQEYPGQVELARPGLRL